MVLVPRNIQIVLGPRDIRIVLGPRDSNFNIPLIIGLFPRELVDPKIQLQSWLEIEAHSIRHNPVIMGQFI